jgi:hypothetical protein
LEVDLFTISVLMTLGPYVDLVEELRVLGARLTNFGFIDTAITAGDGTIGFTAQREASDASSALRDLRHIVFPHELVSVNLDKEEDESRLRIAL